MSKVLRIAFVMVIILGSGLACHAFARSNDSISSSISLDSSESTLLTPATPVAVDSAALPLIPVTGQSTPQPLESDLYPVTFELREDTPIPNERSVTDPFETMLFKLINEERRAQNLEPLSLSTRLSRLAREHSKDMASHDFFGHEGTDGQSFGDRMKNNHQTYQHAAENLFAGNGPYNSPSAAIKAWKTSAIHRNNMMNPDYTEIGIGYFFNPKSRYGGYFTVDFVTP